MVRRARGAPVSLRAALCVAAAGAALAAAPVGAAARRSATFTVHVNATSSSSATLQGEICGIGMSSTSATYTAPPFKIRVDDLGGAFTVMSGLSPKGETGRQYFLMNGQVSESNSGELACKDNPMLPSDCGTKPFSGMEMTLQGDSPGRQFNLNLLDGGVSFAKPLFENCYTATGWGLGNAYGATPLPVAKSALFDRHRRTIVVTGTTSVTGLGGYGASTKGSGRVTLTLTRLGRGR
jgi:hypothetical protein